MDVTIAADFGLEVKPRTIPGTYALLNSYYKSHYGSAQRFRTLMRQDLAQTFTKADGLISPTAPTTAFKIGEKVSDPLAMYLNDIVTIPANLAGILGMSRSVCFMTEIAYDAGDCIHGNQRYVDSYSFFTGNQWLQSLQLRNEQGSRHICMVPRGKPLFQ